MEWLVLVLLVPAILVPVVLLWGFTGCKFEPGRAPSPPLPPTDLSAAGVSVGSIALAWANPNTVPVTFQIERTREGESTSQVLVSSTTTVVDAGLDEATTYFYRVRAIQTSDGNQSALSDQAAGRTIGLAFQATLTNDQTALEGFCFVQRIEPTKLRQSTLPGGLTTLGARVRITLRGSTAANLVLDRVFISQTAATGDPYDSAGDLTHVASNVVVEANTPLPLPDVDYDLDHTRPLLVAFDLSQTPGSGNARFVTNILPTDAAMYFFPDTAEAGVADRKPSVAIPSPPYAISNSIYLVEKIEVV